MAKRRSGKAEIEIDGLEETLQQLKDVGFMIYESTDKAALAAVNVIESAASERAPRPGIIEHKKSWARGRGKVEYTIGVNDSYETYFYIFFETGVTAHEIKPRERSGLLSFIDENGDKKAVKIVKHHPGFAARPFLRPAIDTKKDAAVQAAGDVWNNEVSKAVSRAKLK